MTDLRIGAIGCGYWGPNLIRNFVENPGASVIAVSALQVEPMNRMRQRFPEIEYAVRDYREMFDMNLDAVSLAQSADEVKLVVGDGGVGFDITGPPPGGGQGLPQARQRVELYGGRLALASQPGAGTRVTITMPLKKQLPA